MGFLFGVIMDRVEITWSDSTSFANNWMDEGDVKMLIGRECRTRGYLIYRDKDFLRIAQSVSDDNYYNIMVIPTGAVKKLVKK